MFALLCYIENNKFYVQYSLETRITTVQLTKKNVVLYELFKWWNGENSEKKNITADIVWLVGLFSDQSWACWSNQWCWWWCTGITSLADWHYCDTSVQNQMKWRLVKNKVGVSGGCATYRLFDFPTFHSAFILFKLMTPIGIDFTKLGFIWCGTCFYKTNKD